MLASNRCGICQIFITSKIPKLLNFTQEKRVNRSIFGQTLKMEDVLVIFFEQKSPFVHCVLKYKLAPYVHMFNENSSMNSAHFTGRNFFPLTRTKLAYGRPGLDWIVGPEYSFGVLST